MNFTTQRSKPAKKAHFELTPSLTDYVIASYVCVCIVLGFLLTSSNFSHWFIIPVLGCGIVIGADAVRWFRRMIAAFDPVGIIGLLGFHFFFLAPLLHVWWDVWMKYVVPPADWRDWLGVMATANFGGLLVYTWSRYKFRTIFRKRSATTKTVWEVKEATFLRLTLLLLLISGLLQAWIYMQFGGILGYISAYEEGSGAFRGMGWLFMLSESFPILAFMAFALISKKRGSTWRSIVAALIVFFTLKLLFGGLRGSRSNTLWGLFWAVGIVAFWIKPIPRKLISIGIVSVVLFTYIYGFYKENGLDGLIALSQDSSRQELVTETNRTIERTLLGDFARSDVQAFIVYRLLDRGWEYNYAYGRTYAGAVALLVPNQIWPTRPTTKLRYGTEIQYGVGSYAPMGRVSSRVYGLAGEAMLNFGVAAAPFSFVVPGVLVAFIEQWRTSWKKSNDLRLLMLPFLINFCFTVLISDSDNLVFFLVKNGALPFLLIFLASRKTSAISKR